MDNLKTFIRSRAFIGTIISVAVIALISLAFFYPDSMQGNQLRQHDTQQGLAIGHEAETYREATGETSRWTNSLFSGMPTFQIAPSYDSDSLFSWVNTLMGLGLPSPSNLIAMMALGFFILLMVMRMRWYVALIGALGYAFSSYFIIIIGAGHIWKFVTLAYVPPTIAGVMLAYRGRYIAGCALAAFFAMMQIAANHVQMSYYFMFVIAGISIAYLVKAIKGKKLRRWVIATCSLAVAGALAVGANLPSLYNTYEYSKYTMRGGHSELTRNDGGNADATTGLDRSYITQYSYGPSETFTLLIPNVKGGASMKPEKGQNKLLSLSLLPDAKKMMTEGKISPQEGAYLEYMSQYFGEPEGTNGPVYVGALIVALFLLGCAIVRGPMKWALVILTLLSILLALGRNCMWLTDLMIDYMPMYNKFRTVESILVIAEFTMPLLAAMALQKIVTEPKAFTLYRKPLLWSFGIVMGLCLLGVILPGIYGSVISDNDRQIDAMIAQSLAQQGYGPDVASAFSLSNPRIYDAVESLRQSMITSDALRSLLFVAAGFGVLLLFMRRKISLAVTISVVGLLVIADLYNVNKRYISSESFIPKQLTVGEPFPLTDTDRQILADTTAHYRVMDIPHFWQADPSYRHKTIGGYHAAKLTRYQDLIDTHLSHFLNGTQTDADWNVLNMLNARYIVDHQGEPLFNEEAYGNAWLVDTVKFVDGANAEMDLLSSINTVTTAVADRSFENYLPATPHSSPADTIFLTSYTPNRLTYHSSTAGDATAVFSEVYFPWGWKATIDGRPATLARVNYILRALNIPAGSHTIEMTFDPDSIKATTTAATISVILIYLLLAFTITVAVMHIISATPAGASKPKE